MRRHCGRPSPDRRAASSTGHPLTTAAAFEILLKGGNAFDAGVTSLIVGGVLEQDLYSLGGEALVLVYPQEGRQGHLDRRAGLGAEGRGRGLVHVTRQDARRRGTRSGRRSGCAARRADGPREVGDDELRRCVGARDRIRGRRLPASQQHGARHRAATRVLQEVARQPEVLAEGRRHDLQARRDDQAADARAHAEADGRGRARGEGQGTRRRHRRRSRSLLQGRHREGDGGVPAAARRAVRPERLRRVLRARRGAGEDDVSRLHRLQALVHEPGAGAAAGAQHPRELRSPRRCATTAPTTSTPSSKR